VPHVMPADLEKYNLYKTIEDKTTRVAIAYRATQCDSITVPQSTGFTWRLSARSCPERPRYIIVGFQTDRTRNQEKNPSIFNHANVVDIWATLNSSKHPTVSYNISFPMHKYSRPYHDAVEFRSKLFNMDELVSNCNITPSDYKSLYPLFVFDVSKQSEKLKESVTDIHIKAQFGENAPANTEAYAVLISDKMLSFQSDGNKMFVV